MVTASAPAKIILLGEHSVVYGYPALAIPVSSLRATAQAVSAPAGTGLRIAAQDLGRELPVMLDAELANDALAAPAQLLLNHFRVAPPDLNILVRSDIPMASGLGSGAAISTVVIRALSAALSQPVTSQELNDLVYQVEKIHHGTPSGIDNTVIVYEQPVYFVRGQPIEFLSLGGQFSFLIADTGIAALTRVAVGDVAALYKSDPPRWEAIFRSIAGLVDRARTALSAADAVELGSLMNQNHEYLQQLTVSSPELDKLVAAAQSAGALGAKLSGGGRGGNMIALVTPDTIQHVQQELLNAGAVRVFPAVLA